jgi:hypothetical protein
MIDFHHGDKDRFFFQGFKSGVTQAIRIPRKGREVLFKMEGRVSVEEVDSVPNDLAVSSSATEGIAVSLAVGTEGLFWPRTELAAELAAVRGRG